MTKVLNDSAVSKFVTRKCIEVNGFQYRQYSNNKDVKFKIPVLGLNLWNYSDAYIIVKVTIELLQRQNR